MPDLRGLPSVLDLATVTDAMRADIWIGAAPSIFPGLSVKALDIAPSVGLIQRSDVGSGSLFIIQSAPAEVNYVPAQEYNERGRFVTLMLEVDGAAQARQRNRQCDLGRGDICFIDERYPFCLTSSGCSSMLLLRMPRPMVLSRYPGIEHMVATLMSGTEAGTELLAQTLVSLCNVVHDLRDGQRVAALNAIVEMIGTASAMSVGLESTHWRVQKALDFIEFNLSLPGLTAEQVANAQHISRRRLDQLMREALGVSITARIWGRRLQRAAGDLGDPKWAGASIAQIAFANGFEDSAHFARAFKRQFEATPGQWRARTLPRAH